MVTLGCRAKKPISRHDIYNKVYFGLRKINRKNFSSNVIDSYIRSTPGSGVGTTDRGTCADTLSFLRVVNIS